MKPSQKIFLTFLASALVAVGLYFFMQQKTGNGKIDESLPESVPQSTSTTEQFKDHAYIENKLKKENWGYGLGFSDQAPGHIEEHTEYNTYINTIWGFKFDYPKDWQVDEGSFGSGVSLFNVTINPKAGKRYPDTIGINITPKYWIEKVLKTTNPHYRFSDVEIFNKPAIHFHGVTFSTVPTEGYFILIDDKYWIDLTVTLGFEEPSIFADQWQMVLDSFEFLGE